MACLLLDLHNAKGLSEINSRVSRARMKEKRAAGGIDDKQDPALKLRHFLSPQADVSNPQELRHG
jgi:hypothetical protein